MNTAFDPTIFSAYDVRGIYGENLTGEVAYCIGRAAALYLNAPEIAVGRDMRLSSPQLSDALLQGIVDQGVNAADIARPAAKALGGGTGNQSDVAVGGGPNGSGVEEARALLEQHAKEALAGAGSR